MKNELTSLLLTRAEALAEEYYGCGLNRLDPDELAYYTERVSEDSMDDLAEDLAHAAWQAN